MGSINFNTFGNWFQKPSNPIPPINLLSGNLLNTPRTLKFASISSSNTSKKAPNLETPPSEEPGKYNKILELFFLELETMPNFRHAPEVERILNEDPNFENKANPTEEEIRENKKWRNEFRSSPVVQLMARAEEIAMKMNEMELEKNANPHWDEDSLYIGEENSEAPPLSPIEAKIQQLAEKFVEVICKSSGRTRQFAAGTEAGFAIYLINKKLDTGVPLALHIEAVKEGEEPVSFGPNAVLVDYGDGWKLETVTEVEFAGVLKEKSSTNKSENPKEFTADDKTGEAEIDIRPYVECLRMGLENLPTGTVITKVLPSRTNCLSDESCCVWDNGRILQDMFLRLRNVEYGEIEVQIEWINPPGCKGVF